MSAKNFVRTNLLVFPAILRQTLLFTLHTDKETEAQTEGYWVPWQSWKQLQHPRLCTSRGVLCLILGRCQGLGKMGDQPLSWGPEMAVVPVTPWVTLRKEHGLLVPQLHRL